MLAERKKERVREKEREGERERAIIAAVIVRGRVRACEISYYPGTMSVQCHEKGESNLVCVHTRGIYRATSMYREKRRPEKRAHSISFCVVVSGVIEGDSWQANKQRPRG